MSVIQQIVKENDFAKRLKAKVAKPLSIRWNQNLSTMISIREGEESTRVSIHRMFQAAPDPVFEALVRFVQGKQKTPGPVIRRFIEENFQRLDYGNRVCPSKLVTKGHVFDLQKVYDRINDQYFQNSLDLRITWYGRPRRRACSHVTFGLYWDPLKLVKIHRLLDDPRVPHYVVSFVVYHEMLHAAYPSYVDDKGCHRVHHPKFQEEEKRFHYYRAASKWIAENQTYIFGGRR